MRTCTLSLLFVAFFYTISCFGQKSIKGKIIDSESGEPLAFVNIIFNSNPHLGTVSDIDGKFSAQIGIPIDSVQCSYVGYEKKTVVLNQSINRKNILIRLKPSSVQLKEVRIYPGINPAHRIIKKAIENKEINHPENIDYFKYSSYNKSFFDFAFNDSLVDDSIKIQVDSALQGGHLFLMESVTERKYIHPDISEEVIIGTRVSGFKHPSFATLATDLQPFSFYDDLIPIIDITYLNPISKGSTDKYYFHLEDTLYQGLDSVFIISFKPKPKKNFDGLEGLLYINTNKYAIQNVIAEPYKKGFIDIKIQQKYQLIDGKQWFPQQLNYEFKLNNYITTGVGLIAVGKSYIKDVELDIELERSDFSIETTRMDEEASERDSAFWEKHRVEALDKAEKATYRLLDSIGEKHNFDGFLHFMEKFVLGKIPIGFVDLDLTETLIYNDYEGFRFGFGAYTNEKVSKIFSVGGFFGYGQHDHKWKYGGELLIALDRNKELQLKLSHRNTLLEAGRSYLDYFKLSPYDTRSYLAFRMDHVVENSFSIGFRALRYAKMEIGFYHSKINPKYEYTFKYSEENLNQYTNSSIKLRMRYAYKEKLVESFGQRMSMGTDYPVLHLSYSKGIEGFQGAAFDYNKVEIGIEENFLTRSLGASRIRLNAGIIDRPLPYGMMFTGEGSYDEDLKYVVRNHFQTVKPYEFLSDRYVDVFFQHSFKSLLLQVGKFRPYLTVSQNIGFGELENPTAHQKIDFKTKEKGLYETGLIIDNILRMNYVNIGYLGFGFGAFYRYGAYASEKQMDNFAFKFSVMFSTI